MSDLANRVAGLLERAYTDMDERGFLPPTPCRVCGEMLSDADGPRPAETYAGTFTGLCYGCERSGPYVVPGSELPDGARLVSHPPSCPSWRRDRTEHWAYPDCPDCGGQGASVRYSSMSHGNYTEHCRACAARVTAPRKANNRAFLTAVADALETAPLEPREATERMTITQATVVAAAGACAARALEAYADAPAVWRPTTHLIAGAERRIKHAQLEAKRPDTLRRALVAALRAEATS